MLQRKSKSPSRRARSCAHVLVSDAEAWHVVNATDPLEDSDKEQDEHVRIDYSTSHFPALS